MKQLVIMNVVDAEFPIFIAASFPDFDLLHIRYMVQHFTLYFAVSQLIIIYCCISDIWWLLHSKTSFCCISDYLLLHSRFLLLHSPLFFTTFQAFGAAFQNIISLHFRLFVSGFQIFIAAFSIIYYCITYYIWLLSRLFVSGFQIFIAAFSIIYFYLPDLYCCILHYLLLSLFPIFHLCTSDIC